MKNWVCLCGNFVREKRFCPRCKLMRFRIENSPVLAYFGLKLGMLSDGLPFNYPIDRLGSHVLIAGMTGTGKTKLGMKLAVKSENEPLPHRIKLLVMDVEGEWKNIIPLLKEKTEYFSVGGNLKINPFELEDPALIRELMRQTVFKGIEKEYVDLTAQMNFVLTEAVNESSNMEELIANIKNYDKKKLTSLDKTKTALLVRLDPFMRSPLKEIFFCKKSNPQFDRLDERNIVIDLHELDRLVAYSPEVRLIYNIITIYYLRKMLNRETCNFVSNLFVADEAQLLVPKILHKLIVTESWHATEFATRLRKRGCGLVLITQSPSNIEEDIFKNTSTRISFRLQDQKDIKLISDSTGFTDIVEHEYLTEKFVNFQTKQAIVSISGYEPFLIIVDNFEVENYDIPLQKIEPEVKPVKEELNVEHDIFLESVEKEPFLAVRERRKTLGWNDKRYYEAVRHLLKKGTIEEIKARIGRGKPVTLYQKVGTIPSVKHEYYVHWICEKLRARGYAVKKNVKEGPDIEIPQINVAIEVELGHSDMIQNVHRNLHKFERVIVCSDEKGVLQNLSKQIQSPKILYSLIQNAPSLLD